MASKATDSGVKEARRTTGTSEEPAARQRASSALAALPVSRQHRDLTSAIAQYHPRTYETSDSEVGSLRRQTKRSKSRDGKVIRQSRSKSVHRTPKRADSISSLSEAQKGAKTMVTESSGVSPQTDESQHINWETDLGAAIDQVNAEEIHKQAIVPAGFIPSQLFVAGQTLSTTRGAGAYHSSPYTDRARIRHPSPTLQCN